MEARESMEYKLTQIKGKRGSVGGQREHEVNVDADIGKKGRGWRGGGHKRAWN